MCLFLFFQDMAVATVYTNLGDEAVAHALNETQVKVVVTSHELLPKFKVMLEKLPEIRHVIVMEDQLHPTVTTGFKEGVAIHQFRSVVTRVRCVDLHCLLFFLRNGPQQVCVTFDTCF